MGARRNAQMLACDQGPMAGKDGPMANPIVIAGYGPGISHAMALAFGKQGFRVALASRTQARLAQGVDALKAQGVDAHAYATDLGDIAAVRALMSRVHEELGPVQALHWNAYAGGLAGDLTTCPPAELATVLQVAVHGLVAATQAALDDLRATQGALLVTGGGLGLYDPQSDQMAASWNAMGLAVAKAAQHKLVGALHQKLKPSGVYVGEVTVTNLVKGTPFDRGTATLEASTVAAAFWELYQKRDRVYTTVH